MHLERRGDSLGQVAPRGGANTLEHTRERSEDALNDQLRVSWASPWGHGEGDQEHCARASRAESAVSDEGCGARQGN